MIFTACLLIALASAADLPPTLEQQLIAEGPTALAKAARTSGESRRGALVFHQPGLACVRCHAAEGGGKALGPDLSKLGKEATDAHLVESILEPSKTIRQGFQSVTIARANGETLAGLLDSEDATTVTLRDLAHDGRPIAIPRKEIDDRRDGGPSLMPAGLVNQLPTRQAFLDLVRYLIEIAEGGPDRARQLRPSAGELAPPLPDYERDLDHAGLIADLGPSSFERGQAIYLRVCANCHGTKDQPGSLPNSLRFASGAFKNGGDPYRMYQTLTLGFGQMAPQTWMVPGQKYDVIHYIREAYLKPHNPSQYARVDRPYVDRLPKGKSRGPAPSTIEPWTAMDYGPTLSATYEVGEDGTNFAFKGVAVRLDGGPGGVSRGHQWAVYDHDTMRLAAAWGGEGFIDWNGINFNGRHGIHPRVAGRVRVANPAGPGWANPAGGLFEDPRTPDRDGRRHGPLPRSWVHYRGQYRHADRVILAYTVGTTPVLEMPGLEIGPGATPVLTRSFELGARRVDLTLRVAHRAGETSMLSLFEAESGRLSILFPNRPNPAGTTVASATSGQAGGSWGHDGNGNLIYEVKAGTRPLRFTIRVASVAEDADPRALAAALDQAPPPDLTALTQGGPSRWPEILKTSATIGPSDGPLRRRHLGHARRQPLALPDPADRIRLHPRRPRRLRLHLGRRRLESRRARRPGEGPGLATVRLRPVPAARVEDPRRQGLHRLSGSDRHPPRPQRRRRGRFL